MPKSLIVICPQCNTGWVIDFQSVVKCLKCALECKVREKGVPVISEEKGKEENRTLGTLKKRTKKLIWRRRH